MLSVMSRRTKHWGQLAKGNMTNDNSANALIHTPSDKNNKHRPDKPHQRTTLGQDKDANITPTHWERTPHAKQEQTEAPNTRTGADQGRKYVEPRPKKKKTNTDWGHKRCKH